MNEFSGIIRRCIDDYNMIEENDKIAVGVSGGKDSLVLLSALKYLQGYYPRSFILKLSLWNWDLREWILVQ